MSLLTKKHDQNTGTSNIDWNPSVGWHEVRIVAVADTGAEPNKFNDGKMQDKISVCFAFDETVEIDGVQIPKTKVEKFTASLNEKAGLVTKVLSPAGISVESFDEMLGKTLKLKLAFDKTGKYLNIVNADESEKPLDATEGLYVPKFWLVDKEGNETGNDILAEDGVAVALMPKKDEVKVESSKPVEDSTDDEGLYA